MPRTHQPYPPEYRRRIIELARAGRSVGELAREFEPTVETIRQ
jgi:transposase-like protein